MAPIWEYSKLNKYTTKLSYGKLSYLSLSLLQPLELGVNGLPLREYDPHEPLDVRGRPGEPGQTGLRPGR